MDGSGIACVGEVGDDALPGIACVGEVGDDALPQAAAVSASANASAFFILC
jgi:hypothetical protein